MKNKIPNDKWYNFEATDRVSMILDQLDNAFWGSADDGRLHPSLDTKEKVELYHKAMQTLGKLYQKIGEREFPQEEV